MKIRIGFILAAFAVALLIGVRALEIQVKESETVTNAAAAPSPNRVAAPIQPGLAQEDVLSRDSRQGLPRAPESLEEIVWTIAQLEDTMERSGLMNKARTQSLSDEEGQELAEMINEVLELRDRELSLRIEKLNARFNQAGSTR